MQRQLIDTQAAALTSAWSDPDQAENITALLQKVCAMVRDFQKGEEEVHRAGDAMEDATIEDHDEGA